MGHRRSHEIQHSRGWRITNSCEGRRKRNNRNNRNHDKYASTDTFDMYMHMFSLCLPPHHHQQWIVGDGEAANITKTYAYTYQMCPYLYIYVYIYKYGHILYVYAYVFAMFAASPSPTMEAPQRWAAAEGGRPPVWRRQT